MEKKFFLCRKCGNVAFKIVDSGIIPSCCGQEMEELVAKTADTGAEKHVPVATQINDCTITIKVGSIAHPMMPEHRICFIYLETKNGDQIKWLNAGDAPSASFHCLKEDFIAAYEYCNLHGLWKTTEIASTDDCQDYEQANCETNGCQCAHILRFFFSFMLVTLGFMSCKCQHNNDFNNTPVANFNLKQYMGEWFEIARYDHNFEAGVSNTKASYYMDDGIVRIKNSGWKKEHFNVSLGRAKQPDAQNNPGLLRVSFFRPFYSDYRILMVDPQYEYALVGSKSKDYLWLLSRTPVLSQNKTQILLNEAQRRGYGIDNLLWIDQRKNSQETIPFQ